MKRASICTCVLAAILLASVLPAESEAQVRYGRNGVRNYNGWRWHGYRNGPRMTYYYGNPYGRGYYNTRRWNGYNYGNWGWNRGYWNNSTWPYATYSYRSYPYYSGYGYFGWR